ncbi:MAG: hypothetical protein WBZ36_28200 [Candidatus Nitrosopolaris sp.]
MRQPEVDGEGETCEQYLYKVGLLEKRRQFLDDIVSRTISFEAFEDTWREMLALEGKETEEYTCGVCAGIITGTIAAVFFKCDARWVHLHFKSVCPFLV